MKNLSLVFLATVFLAGVLLSGCKKDDKSLIEGTWFRVKLEERTGNNQWQVNSQSCKLDDVEVYEKGGGWTFYAGPNQCSPGTGVIAGTWELRASDTKVVFTYDNAVGEYESTVEVLTEESLVLTNSAGDLSNTQYRSTYTK
jgi:hypothetical protein